MVNTIINQSIPREMCCEDVDWSYLAQGFTRIPGNQEDSSGKIVTYCAVQCGI
jgi:hypothetical protein